MCTVEQGYFCTGGSPDSPDVCTNTLPTKVDISLSGQAHTFGKIILNIRVNYLSQALIDFICQDKCEGVLKVELINCFTAASNITSIYTEGSTYSFAVTLDFGREPIGEFDASVRIDP